MEYFLIGINYKEAPFRRTEHIIKANSKEECLQIREKYGISYPMKRKDIASIFCVQLDLQNPAHFMRIESRKRKINGSIWYEENNELKTETIKSYDTLRNKRKI